MLKSTVCCAMIAISGATGAVCAEEPSAATVVATVNGKEITLGHMIAMRESLPPQYLQLDDETLFNGILDQIIQQESLAEAAKPGLKLRDTLMIENSTRSYLASVSLDQTAAAAVTDEALQTLFDARYGAEEPGQEYHAAHILVATEDEAKAIGQELAAGADFATIAAARSSDHGSAAAGGDLGWFGLGMMVKPFEDAVIALEPGAISAPVESQFGWHIIRLDEVRSAARRTIEDVREGLAGELQGAAVEAKITELTEAASIEKKTEGIDPAILKDTMLIDN